MKVRPAWAEEALSKLSDQLAKLPDLTKGINVRPEGKRTMWQPIDTAPKEGEHILLWATSFPCPVVAFWDNSYDSYDDHFWHYAEEVLSDIYGQVEGATHWCRYPTPPGL